MRKFSQRVVKTVASMATLVALIVAASTSAVFAVTSSDLFFNVNASDPGSYSTSTPGTWTDLSATGRNGTIYGTLNYNSGTGALEFPGFTSSYVDMGSGFNNFGSGITIEFEGHFGAINSGWERIFDFGRGEGVDNIWVGVFGESFSPNSLAIELWDGTAGKGRCISPSGFLVANTFAKYVITMDGSKCRMYKNGTEVQTQVGDGGSSYSYSTATYGSTYNFLPNNVTRTKNYIGKSNWASDPAFNGAIKYVRIYTTALTATDVTTNSTSYSLTYSTSGSNTGTAPSTKTGNGLVTLDSNSGSLAKTGHTFVGWAASVDQTSGTTGSYNLTSDVTLYPAFAPNSYNVTYDEHSGSTVPDGTFTHGGTLTYPTNPTRSGYSFIGWFAAASGGNARTASAVAADNASVTLHAQWSPNTYNVTYDEHGGSPVTDGNYVFGNTLVFPTAPTRSGYSFSGWFAAATGGSALTAAGVSAGTSDVTLHAQWAALPTQSLTWAPNNTTVQTNQSPLTPSSLASTNGNGAITYSVFNAGATGCSVNSSTGVVTFSGVGNCVVRATASGTASYAEGYTDVTYAVTSTSPALSLNLVATTGATVANSPVDYGASGLMANTAWSLVLRSTPQTIASGTYSGSVIGGTAQIPSGLSAGWHSITLTGVSPTGSSLSHAIWFEVSSSGTLLHTTSTDPEPVATEADSSPAGLALTGRDLGTPFLGGMLLLLLGSVFVAARRLRMK